MLDHPRVFDSKILKGKKMYWPIGYVVCTTTQPVLVPDMYPVWEWLPFKCMHCRYYNMWCPTACLNIQFCAESEYF